MDSVTIDDLKALIERQDGPCVSLFMPTHRAGADTQQDPIRFRNLLRQAEERLLARGLRRPDVNALLEPARKLHADSAFWWHQSDGLAVFLAEDLVRSYRVPLNLDELATVADRFHVKPLLPLFTGDGRFYVLAISQNAVRLLQGTRHSVDEVEVPDMPASLADALGIDEKEGVQVRSGGAYSKAEGGGIFHGHDVTPQEKAHIRQFFHRVDERLRPALSGERAPLVLAAVDFLFPIYEDANGYGYLVTDEGIEGNPEELSNQALHQGAWAIVAPLFKQAQAEAAAEYAQLAGSGDVRASNQPGEVVAAAYHGRVKTLFVPVGVQQWGRFDPETGAVALHADAERDDEDLLDFAAIHTLVNNGAVYAVPPDQVPGGALIAAVFRY